MGVYIKGMEMPQNCPSCPFNRRAWYEDSHRCLASNKQITVNLSTGFDDNCPLVSVQSHGRLGDLDKLENGLRHMAKYQHGERQQGILGCCETIRLAPTVIEAEEGE